MDEDDFMRLEKLVKENNEILRGMRHSMRVGRFFSILYWVFFVGIAFGAYYFVQPFVEPFVSVFQTIISSIGNLEQGIDGVPRDIPSVLEKLQSK